MSGWTSERASAGSTRASARALGGLALLSLGCLAPSCGSEEPSPKPPAEARAPAPNALDAERSRRPRLPATGSRVFPGRLPGLPPAGLAIARRIDPLVDGWPEEATALALEADLAHALEQVLAGELDLAEALAPLSAPGFEGATAFLPGELTPRFDDGAIAIVEGGAASESVRDPAALAALGEAWRARLAASGRARVEVHATALEPESDGRARVRLVVRASAPAGAGRVQHDLELEAFLAAPSGAPQLVSLASTRFRETRTRAPVLAEVTRAAFGALPFFESELATGNDEEHLRQDRLARQPFIGMHGIAVADFDRDGLEDIYLAMPGGVPNRLLRHRPDGTLEDISAAAEVDFLDNTGPVLLSDLDGDGHQDVVSAIREDLLIAWNDGTGRCREHTRLPAGDIPEVSDLSAADADGDGDLDLFVGRYVAGSVHSGVPVPYHEAENGARNLYWRNLGARRFEEASAEVGLDVHATRFTLASLWEDFDEDGDQDLYVVNDFGSNCLYRNDGGHFVDVASQGGATDAAAGMGASAADVDHDGDLDLFVTNMTSVPGMRVAASPRYHAGRPDWRPSYAHHARGNTLLLQELESGRALVFEDVTEDAGLEIGGWAWSGRFGDLNSDGLEDVYVPNGFVGNFGPELESFFWRVVIGASRDAPPLSDYDLAWAVLRHLTFNGGWSLNGRERNHLYVDLGGAHFADVSAALGVDHADDARAVVPLDWDGDGRLDLLVRNRTAPRVRLLDNVHPEAGNALLVELVGAAPNTDAIGARVVVEAGGIRHMRGVRAAEGFLASGPRRLHVGLGAAEGPVRLAVRWPDGSRQEFEALPANRRIVLRQGAQEPEIHALAPRATPRPLAAEPLDLVPSPCTRVPLLDRMPLSAAELPSLSGAPKTIADFAGRPLLVVVGPLADPEVEPWLARLAARRSAIEARGGALWIVALDQGPALGRARRNAAELGLADVTGVADAGTRGWVEAAVTETLGLFTSLPLPFVFGFDRGGQLALFHTDLAPVAELVGEIERLARLDPAQHGAEELLGGRWVDRPSRDLERLERLFNHIALPALASQAHAELEAREAASKAQDGSD